MPMTSTRPFSISLGANKSKPPSRPPPNPKKRPHSALADPESENEEHAQPQLVTGFDQSTGGAVSAHKTPEKSPLIIQAQKNRNWRDESRRKRGKKNLLPPEVQAARNGENSAAGGNSVERDDISKEAGLRFVEKDLDGDITLTNSSPATPEMGEAQEATEVNADDEAIEALMGKQKKSNLVIHASNTAPSEEVDPQDDAQADAYMNEDDRFRADVAARPDTCTLDEYAAIPVEDFGAAMLRGMGWKEGQIVGRGSEKAKAPRVVEKRPALLGIGAKEVPGGVGEELGAWGKPAKGKKKVDMAYSPVLLQNSATGEKLTEEELEKKKAEARKKVRDGEEDWRDRRDKNLSKDKERKRERLAIEDGRNGEESRRRERSRSRERKHRDDSHSRKKRDRSKDSGRHSSSRRERSRSRDRDRDRHGSSRRERSRSRDRKSSRRDYDDHDRRHRDYDRYDKDHRRR